LDATTSVNWISETLCYGIYSTVHDLFSGSAGLGEPGFHADGFHINKKRLYINALCITERTDSNKPAALGFIRQGKKGDFHQIPIKYPTVWFCSVCNL
jgi:hypothetical protein